ncbi:MAG: sigma-70 family RNA polymerase sigma factor [Candidatus Binatia bacterium]
MKSPPTPADQELMLAYQDGDEEAFTLLFKRYELRIFNYFLRQIGSRPLAEDLLQNTFLKVHRSRRSYQPSAAFSTWIFTIASNLLRDAARVEKRRGGIVELEEVRERIATGSSPSEPFSLPRQQNPEVETGEREIADYVRQAVQALPFDQRQVIILAKYEGFKYEEIAEILNTTPGALKVKAHRAMKTLERVLKNRLRALPL